MKRRTVQLSHDMDETVNITVQKVYSLEEVCVSQFGLLHKLKHA